MAKAAGWQRREWPVGQSSFSAAPVDTGEPPFSLTHVIHRFKQIMLHFAANPLVPAAALFLAGAAAGSCLTTGAGILLGASLGGFVGWLILEWWMGGPRAAGRILYAAHGLLAIGICSSGALLMVLDQKAVANTEIARFAPDRGESLLACRAQVITPPPGRDTAGNETWIARVREIWTDQGWLPADGNVRVKSAGVTAQAQGQATRLERGMVVELYGWLSRPLPAMNPGAQNPRQMLAADRIFAQVRVPRARGIVLLEASAARPVSPLSRLPLFLRSKLLEHTIQQDVPAAYTLTALLLGYRDPAISDVSQAFANAGVAYLLAISGCHIILLTAMVWAVLRLVPLRPRRRDLLVGLIVVAYVLATPCGPPIVRATVAVLLVLAARILGRQPQPLNILAAAALIVILLRPADIADAGFQLTFVTTAGLALFAGRLHAALFGKWLARQSLRADLSRNPWDRVRLRSSNILARVVEGNGIGSLAAAPLVAFHFGQVNLWGMLTGFLALPVVAAAMLVGMLQLLAELIWSGLGAAFSPISAFTGRALIAFIKALAALPGAAVALRPPPIWAILLAYAALLLWMARRRLGISRALVINLSVATLVVISAWYTVSSPVGEMQLTVLSAGDGTAMLLCTPRGEWWAIDAGSGPGLSVQDSAIRPAMRLAGRRHLDGEILTALDVNHAGEAADVAAAFEPRNLWTSAPAWAVHGQTLAGAQLADVAQRQGKSIRALDSGGAVELGEGALVEVLWPPVGAAEKNLLGRRDLILLAAFDGRKILIADPTAENALATVLISEPQLHCDAIIFVGPQRGAADDELRRLVAPLNAQAIIWNGRGNWAPRNSAPGEWNSADGALTLVIHRGSLTLTR